MSIRQDISCAFKAAIPIMLGYIAIGIPCGILNASIGLNALQVLAMSLLFYSGAGQFMIPNMYLAGAPLFSIIASVSLVNTRQMLYAASFSRQCGGVRKRLAFLFGATVTDESFGVNTEQFEQGEWSVRRATFVNLFSLSSWALSNVLGVILGNVLNIPLGIASFAMTSIFICLMCVQKMTIENITSIVGAILGVMFFKAVGLGGMAILGGAIVGVVCAIVMSVLLRHLDAAHKSIRNSADAQDARDARDVQDVQDDSNTAPGEGGKQ